MGHAGTLIGGTASATLGSGRYGGRSGKNVNAFLDANPMIDMNTTPLIDVLLVLIVMLVITIPPQTHKVGFDLPGKTVAIPDPDPVRNVLTIERDGVTRWNGQAVADAALRIVLARSASMQPQPELHFRPAEDARYERVDQVLAMAKKAQVTRMGFVGNDRYVNW